MKAISIYSVLILCINASWVTAEEPQPPGPQVVVLQNGSVVQGRIESSRNGMRVTNGPWYAVNVPREDVDFVARDMTEAYGTKLDRIRAGDFDAHVRLAYWCLRYELQGQAADRLLYLSNLDPHNPAISALESQLRQLANRGAAAENTIKLASIEQPLESATDDGDSAANVSTDKQPVPADAVAEFTRSIQPLVLNRCGQTTCHGNAARNSFHLTRLNSSGGVRRDLTLKNLRAVMTYLSEAPVAQTRLYDRATTAHGQAGRAPIEAHEVRQLQRLANWIQQASGQGSAAPTLDISQHNAPKPLASATGTPQVDATDPLARLQAALSGSPSATSMPNREEGANGTAQRVPADRNLAASHGEAGNAPVQSADPYDPAGFNGRFHPAETTAEASPTGEDVGESETSE